MLAEELVPGDLVLIEEGDRISADGRVIFATDLQVNQSALTGESNPVYKNSEADTDAQKQLLNTIIWSLQVRLFHRVQPR